MDRLRGLIYALSHDKDEFEVLAVKDTMIQLGAGTDVIQECIKTLLDRCEDKWQFSASAVHCVMICCNDDQLKANNLRQHFLQQLQNLYKGKTVSLLCIILLLDCAMV